MLNSIIRNGLGKKVAAEVTDDNALKVSTIEYEHFNPGVSFFLNPTYGSDMAINAAPLGPSPENIHNGEDNTYWTASSISGIWDFASEVQAHDGTSSIDATLTIDDDVAQFAKGSDFNLTTFNQLAGWIYITSWPDTGIKEINLTGWSTTSSLQIGVQANIGNYVDITTLNTWQKFIIPLSDMVLQTEIIDAFRLITIDDGVGSPIDFYLDGIVIEGGGASTQEYIIAPGIGQKFHVERINLFMVDDYDTTLADATMPNLEYDKLLGESFITGIIFRVIQNEEITFAFSIKDISDIMMLPTIADINMFSNGTNTGLQFSFGFPTSIDLDSRTEDRLSILITENFSGFLKLGASVASRLENL